MARYRLSRAVSNVVSAVFTWGGLITAGYAAINGSNLVFEFGKLLLDPRKPRPSRSDENDKILDERKVCELLEISRWQLRMLLKSGQFPSGKLIGKRERRWMRSEIMDWVARE